MRPLCFSDTHEIREEGSGVQVLVRDNNVDQALRALKKKLQREGVFREMKLRGHYEKPSLPAKPRPVAGAGGPGLRPATAR